MLRERFGPGCRVVGCSSAGCFAFGGYRDDRVVAVAFPATSFRAETIWLKGLRQHMARDWMLALRRLSEGFAGVAPGWSRFGLLMIDGLCRREELVAATVDATLGTLPVVGGSAGDGLRFGRTHLAIDGHSHPESAVFCLVASAFPVEEVIFDHFTPVGRADGGDRGGARGAGDRVDQRRAGGRGVRPADRPADRPSSAPAPSRSFRC